MVSYLYSHYLLGGAMRTIAYLTTRQSDTLSIIYSDNTDYPIVFVRIAASRLPQMRSLAFLARVYGSSRWVSIPS